MEEVILQESSIIAFWEDILLMLYWVMPEFLFFIPYISASDWCSDRNWDSGISGPSMGFLQRGLS
jgi:hypothetical protein